MGWCYHLGARRGVLLLTQRIKIYKNPPSIYNTHQHICLLAILLKLIYIGTNIWLSGSFVLFMLSSADIHHHLDLIDQSLFKGYATDFRMVFQKYGICIKIVSASSVARFQELKQSGGCMYMDLYLFDRSLDRILDVAFLLFCPPWSSYDELGNNLLIQLLL